MRSVLLWSAGVILSVSVAAAVIYCIRVYSRPAVPKRPSNVPPQAVYVSGPKSRGDWEWCWVDRRQEANRCQISNVGGDVLYEGVFLPYEGNEVVPEAKLKITQHSGPQWVELENGTILIPGSDYPQIKRFLDWLKHKRASP